MWIYEGLSYMYEPIADSVRTNPKASTVQFKLRELDRDDDDLEVVIHHKNGSYFWKTDYYDEPEKEMPLKAFNSADETLLYFNDYEKGDIYFHLR